MGFSLAKRREIRNCWHLYRDLPDQDVALEGWTTFQADRMQGYTRIGKCGICVCNIDTWCSHTQSQVDGESFPDVKL